jgi:putative nucleotidyltransferase with HDIG domain
MMETRIHAILFVDDDPMVLQGMKRSLEEYSDVWVTEFASNAKEALEKLSERQFDAIVTDMHMPVMDGNQLLDLVSKTSPGVMRFILSGHLTDTQVMHSTTLAHQMIAKPCDIDHVFTIVERACRLRDQLTDPELRKLITEIKNLPSVPALYNQLIKELDSPNASTQNVGNIIARDAAMTAKLLQLVNSAFFGLSDNISSPHRAVTILGLNTIKALVLGIHVFSEYQNTGTIPVVINSIWKHSLLVSSVANTIAHQMQLPSQEQENARVSGLLHDIGKLALLSIPEFTTRVPINRLGKLSLDEEYRVLKTSHSEIGGYLLGMWGLPTPIVDAITFHHRPYTKVKEKTDLLTALYLANGLSNMVQNEMEPNYPAYFDMAYIQRAGITGELDEWAEITRTLYTKSEDSGVS